MLYSEAAYFDGNHCQHVAAWEEHKRLKRLRGEAAKAIRLNERRRKIGRELLEVGTNRPVCVVAVEVTSNREAVAREYKATIGYDPFAEGWTLAEAEETLAEYRAEERKAIFGV